MPDEGQDLIALTAEIVAAHVANNSVQTSEVGSLIGNVFNALSGLSAPAESPAAEAKPQPATTARKSLSRTSHIISMIDGKPYKMLRRHLGLHGYTPESYRETFGLPRNYPMVASDYAEQRRALAHKIGLGRKPKAEAPSLVAARPVPGEKSAEASAVAPVKPARRKLKPAFGKAVAAAKHHLGGK